MHRKEIAKKLLKIEPKIERADFYKFIIFSDNNGNAVEFSIYNSFNVTMVVTMHLVIGYLNRFDVTKTYPAESFDEQKVVEEMVELIV